MTTTLAIEGAREGLEAVLTLLPLAAVISLVCGGMRRDAPREIFASSAKLFATLVLGTAAFSLVLQLSLRVPLVFYGLLSAVVLLLAYYTLQEFAGWLRGGPKKGAEEKGGAEAAGGR